MMQRDTEQAVFACFVDHVRNHDRVWVCRRIDIARHWREHHPWPG